MGAGGGCVLIGRGGLTGYYGIAWVLTCLEEFNSISYCMMGKIKHRRKLGVNWTIFGSMISMQDIRK